MGKTRVNSQDVRDQGIATVDIQDNAVTTVKILDANVINQKLDTTGVSAGTYSISSFVVNAQGRITSASNILTTKGDLASYDSSPSRLGVGADGTVLVADSSQAMGLKWLLQSAIAPLSYTSSTGTFSIAGLSSLGAANQILSVNAGATAWEYKTMSGTTNRVTVTYGVGTVTLSGPQDIATTSSPSFSNVSLTGKTPGSVIFAGALGLLSEDNSNLFYDDSNHRLGVGTSAPVRKLDVNGNSIFRGPLRLSDSAFPNSNFETFQADASTTNNAYVTAATVAIPTDSAVIIKVFAVGRRTGGSAGTAQDAGVYERTARFKNTAGIVSIFNLQTDYTSEDQANFDVTMDTSGTDARIRVRGQTNNNLNWTLTYCVMSI